MKQLKGYEIRQKWLDFWKSKGHDIIPSASLVPHNDPTLLWINAGVAPLKKYFDGREIPQNKRMANAQKSIRTNDIENVGKTARHHTFFEMLGNFSIGDYFRDEVLPWAFELLTSEEWFAIDPEKLYFTYYPNDSATYNKWQECGVKEDHLIPVEGNFWEIGEGPCGPDTEIFFDRGESYDPEKLGTKLIKDDIENERFIEIWNIVFSQFNSKPGTPREEYKELPSKNIDTGCGLERVACVMQGVETNYDTDLFMPIIKKTEELTGVKYEGQMAFKVIADHVRSTVFALSDGATFSNEGRGYVLRRILRRAVRYGKFLGMKEAFLYKLVNPCVDLMKVFYPYLLEKQAIVTDQIKLEEEKFLSTLEAGEKRLKDYINSSSNKTIPGEVAFMLYDTFGFPIDLTLEAASEYGFDIDMEGFKSELKAQKERARNARASIQSMNTQNEEMMKFTLNSDFIGYDELDSTSKVIAVFSDGHKVNEASGKVIIVLDKTPFYAEMGGQIGDTGYISINGSEFDVTDTVKLPNGQAGMVVEMDDETIKENDFVKCYVNKEKRTFTEYNHSATHIMNEALRTVIGSHVSQQGSYVSDAVLRFDFNNFSNLSNDEILKIEELVNENINKAYEIKTLNLPIEEAKKLGAQAMFGEKYGAVVRVVDMTCSKEFCGGCHAKNTSDLAKFAILNIESKGSGIFRIEATTSENIAKQINLVLANIFKEIATLEERIQAYAKTLNIECPKLNKPEYLDSYKYIILVKEYNEELKQVAKQLEKQVTNLERQKNALSIDDFKNNYEEVNGAKLLFTKIENADMNNLKDLVDALAENLGNALVMFANINNGKIVFVCKNKLSGFSAGKLVKAAAQICGGNGGGRDDFASAGGKDVSKVDEALNCVKEEVKGVLNN